MGSVPPTIPASTGAPPRRTADPHCARSRLAVAAAGLMMAACPGAGLAWGDEGHEIIARIADHYLEPPVRAKVAALLAADTTSLTRDTGMAAEAAWADKFRDSDRNADQVRYRRTRAWHYIDIELDRPQDGVACSPRAALPRGTPASLGPAQACIVDKIVQFLRELHGTAAAPEERRLALQFLLHLVGDLHQPLHAADDHDHGGNDVMVESAGHRRGSLHHYWDTVFVEDLGRDAGEVAARLIGEISAAQRRRLRSGNPADWARQSFEVARIEVYGRLPGGRAAGAKPGPRAALELELDDAYTAGADRAVAVQLERAGVRLAQILNDDLR